jgi:hypothetical protein
MHELFISSEKLLEIEILQISNHVKFIRIKLISSSSFREIFPFTSGQSKIGASIV